MIEDRYETTPRTRVRRLPQRASYDRSVCHAILDEGMVSHVGIVVDGQPFVLPMAYVRRGEALLLHGSASSRVVRALAAGTPACVTVTHMDGLVLARSAFHHSMNYRSVCAIGSAVPIDDPRRKQEALDAFVERIMPGRTRDARAGNARELKATTIVEFPLTEVSAKIRSGPPVDDPEDLAMTCWAGVIPMVTRALAPVRSPDLADGIAPPAYVTEFSRRRS